jgi:hypothetical protein
MTALNDGVSAAKGANLVPTLCRREAWRFASWWGDFVMVGIIAAVAWLIVANRYASTTLTESLGPITSAAIGACVGAGLPLLARLFGAWRFVRRLSLRRSGEPREGIRTRFLASALQQAGASAMRCSAEDLQRAVAVAASAAAYAARSAAMPAVAVAFVVPAVGLVGGLHMAGRATQSRPIVAMAPSMIAGIVGGLCVMLLVGAFTLVVRKGVERWGAGVDVEEVEHIAGRPISRFMRSAASDDVGGDDNVTDGSSSTVAAEDHVQTLKNLTQSG